MRRNAGLGIDDRKHGRRSMTGHLPARPRLERRHGSRAARDVLGKTHALAPQEVDAPPARVVELPPLVYRRALADRDVRLQRRRPVRKYVDELRSNVVGCRFDRVEPWKVAALVEFDRGQLRKIHEGWLLAID